jgi:Domain of unknown function (DUF309)
VALPLPLRNRLADLIRDALHDREARRGLQAIAAVCADPGALDPAAPPPAAFPAELFDRRPEGWRMRAGFGPHAAAFGERAARAARVLADRPLDAAEPSRPAALEAAGALFDARLYFETHEVLEPFWMRAEGAAREALQGLIQVAVGFEHLANRNLDGALALLREGATKVAGHRLDGRALGEFAERVAGCVRDLVALGPDAAARFDWSRVPRFPGRA